MIWYLVIAFFTGMCALFSTTMFSKFDIMTTLFVSDQQCEILSSRYFEQNGVYGYVYNVTSQNYRYRACSVSQKPYDMDDKLLNVPANEPDAILQNMPLVFCSSIQNYTNNVQCMVSANPYYAVLNDKPYFAQESWNRTVSTMSIISYIFTCMVCAILCATAHICHKPYKITLPDTFVIRTNAGIQIMVFTFNIVFLYGIYVQKWQPYININYPIIFVTPYYMALGLTNMIVMSARSSCYKKSTFGLAEFHLMMFLLMTNLPILIISIILGTKYGESLVIVYVLGLVNAIAIFATMMQIGDLKNTIAKNMTQLTPLTEVDNKHTTHNTLPPTEMTTLPSITVASQTDIESQSVSTLNIQQP